MNRPDCITHFTEIQEDDTNRYPGSNERLAIGSPFGKVLGLKRIAVHHVLLPPGRRTSWPHAHCGEEEFVYVIEGNPQVWLDGKLHDLVPGDGVGFPDGTGESHTFLNNTLYDVRLLVVGDTARDKSKIFYPLHPERKPQVGAHWWGDAPSRKLGRHDGLPDALK